MLHRNDSVWNFIHILSGKNIVNNNGRLRTTPGGYHCNYDNQLVPKGKCINFNGQPIHKLLIIFLDKGK